MALERNPTVAARMLADGHEIATHGYRWIDYQYVGEETERAHLQKAIEIQQQLTGSRPLGCYIGRISSNTRRIVAEEGTAAVVAVIDMFLNFLHRLVVLTTGHDRRN